ncbi:dihydrodipicolinate synthase family protein [Shimwellia blattae]|uniref:Dihydrodipicolinate synthetase family protein n=1 Tax=Shimwellia blattae (strain ATCC 29907 / DSM 4481 / JCM 1650 / NBRC 105725 / CDC 9005-74) TaxID=630626 RepID=I2B945_SHIBC|nr:dihydrodipicolinate synthase family protein [Shimwellia blattae]AFJ47049.1 dihydrodipicolinate synthetase family protein [Shimwellia blattae DSM 4481 = NBRC 105725]GAB80829.1 dihydrodipicolinate synthase [Shimwellia blattae DSM 4481 = NBRC 105725]VDY64542.1 N-acetylneuraminate lyase [Shimwellia blattae]VEC22650.1 N-acetylneuraminate lyase [Shimwellia blattae]
MHKLTGLIAAPHTPFNTDSSVNYPVIDRIAGHLIEQGVNGVYICGTTGEGIHCSVDERKKIAERWVAASQGKLSITLHTGALSIADSLELSRHAETLDIFATSVIGPCFFKPGTVEDLVEYCRIIAAAAPSKGFYYYHSGMSGLSLDMEQFLITAADRIPNLSGMKFNSGDMYEFQRCLRVNNGQFDIPFGVDEFLPAGLACGAVGAVGSTYNYAAPLYHRLIESFNRGDHQDVAACMDKVIAIIRVLVQYGGVAAGKLAMQLHGIDVGDPRRPLRPMTPGQKKEALEKFRAADFI